MPVDRILRNFWEPRLGEGSVLEEANTLCLRPHGRVWERSSAKALDSSDRAIERVNFFVQGGEETFSSQEQI